MPWRVLALVLLGSLAVQLFATANVKLLPDYDEAIYWDVSRNCHHRGLFLRSQNDGILFFDHPPLWLYLASPVFFFTDDIAGFRFAVSLTSLALLAATALLAYRHVSPRAAVVAAIVLGFNPMFVFYANSGYQDVPFMLPIVLAILAVFEGRPIAGGLLTGAACLVKYFAAGFAGVLAGYQAFGPARSFRDAARYLAAFAGVSLLWPVAGLYLDRDGFVARLEYWKSFLNMREVPLKHHPVVDLGPYLHSMVDRLTLLHALLLGAGLLWALVNFRKLSRPLEAIAFTAAAYLATLIGPFAPRTERYLVETLPLLAVLTAGMLQLLRPPARAAVLAIVIFAGLFVPMPGSLRLPPLFRPQYAPAVLAYEHDVKEAARAIARELAPGELVLVDWNGPRFSYLTRRPYGILFPYEDFQYVLKLVDGARVVVRDHESGRWHLPELTPEEIARLEKKLSAEFTAADFGKVRVFTRRPGMPLRRG